MRNYIGISDGFQIVFACFLILANSAPPMAAQAMGEGQSNAFQLKILADRRSYLQGEDIPIHMQLTNVSSHDMLIGREMIWGHASQIRLEVVPKDGHTLSYQNWAADGLPRDAFADFLKSVINWCVSLPPGYSYGATAVLQEFVTPKDLVPGVYRIRARYVSSGIEADSHLNPLLSHPDVLAKLVEESWRGQITSNEITIRIVAKSQS